MTAPNEMNVPTNIDLTGDYLRAVASMESAECVAAFYSPDVVFSEYPNRIVPNGRESKLEDMRQAYGRGQQLLSSQNYDVRRIVDHGDEIAVELVWTGQLAVPLKHLSAGAELRAYVAMFLTFRDGKIVSQRNYDRYEPF